MNYQVPRPLRMGLSFLLGMCVGVLGMPPGLSVMVAIGAWLILEYFCDSFDHWDFW